MRLDLDLTNVAAPSFELMAPGDYKGSIVETNIVETSDKTGLRLTYTVEIIEGEHKGKKIFDAFNIRNKSDKAQAIGQSQLAALCDALGLSRKEKDTDNFHNRPVTVSIGIQPPSKYTDATGVEKEGAAKNIVKGFKSLKSSTSSPFASIIAPIPAAHIAQIQAVQQPVDHIPF